MTGEPTTTIAGNLTADVELRFTGSGDAVANFTVAATPRTLNRNTNKWEDGEPLFMRCTLWRQPGENAAESLTKGARVIVTGRLRQRSYDARDGSKRTVIEMDVDELGASLRYSTAKLTRAAAKRSGSGDEPAQGEHHDEDPGYDEQPF